MELSEENFVQERVIPSLRGRILDAEQRPLAQDRPAYNVYFTPAFCGDADAVLLKLEGYLNLSSEEVLRLRHAAETARGLRRFREIRVKGDISRDQLALIESHKLDFSGVTVRPGPRRGYPHDLLVSHPVGFVGRITARELKARPDYLSFDTIGKKGIEEAFEKDLRGRHGLQRVVVDAQGRMKAKREAEVLLKGDIYTPPVPGHDVVSSLDLDLQAAARTAFGAQAGAVVVMEVETGWIKAWLSMPGFDPNKFADGISQNDWSRYRDSVLDPLMDKVSQASYFPGSTYKVVPAVAALRSEEIGPSSSTVCYGVRKIGDHPFHCWRRSGHGTVNLRRAIKESCDVYFYWVGEQLGFEPIVEVAAEFGLGEMPGSGIGSETAGRLPDAAWHEKTYDRRWFPGDTMSHVIGQGDLKVSPLQLAVLYAAVANGGKVVRPQLVTDVRRIDGGLVRHYKPEVKRVLDADPEILQAVREGLEAVVNEQGGTAYLSRLIEPRFAGKTGTSQVARLAKGQRSFDDYQLKDHAWFVGYAPVEKPQVVVVAVAEHGEHGSWMAPLVRDVIAAWYEKSTGHAAKHRPNEYYSPITRPPQASATPEGR